MKLPQIVTQHKIRDARICRLWARDLMATDKIAEMFNLSQRRIEQIVYANRDFVTLDKEFERSKRARWLKQQIKLRGDSKKDSADLLEQLRKETDGDRAIEFNQVIKVGSNGKLTDADRAREEALLGRLDKYFDTNGKK